jgi:hypothetical protein
MTSVQAGQQPLTGDDRGPLWRRSAFRSATSGWRDFALRGVNSRNAPMGQVVPNDFAEPMTVSREQG